MDGSSTKHCFAEGDDGWTSSMNPGYSRPILGIFLTVVGGRRSSHHERVAIAVVRSRTHHTVASSSSSIMQLDGGNGGLKIEVVFHGLGKP